MTISFLAFFLVVPLVLLAVIWLVRDDRKMTAIAAMLFWLQTAMEIIALFPELSNLQPRLTLAADFSIDRLGAMFVILTQVVVASCMSHAHIFFRFEHDPDARVLRIFYSCTCLFMVAMTFIFFCNNLGALWIGIETTTLCSAPLVYFHKEKNALEAAWKYFIICSVGIAFALLGVMFLFAASQHGAVPEGSLRFSELLSNARELQYPLLKLGYLFCLLGFGTKAGIFPVHSWLPDAYSEAPAPASGMLSGCLMNCALFAIWRVSALVDASGHQSLLRIIGVNAGVITVFFASVFLIRQHGLKRLLAYSSIENAGLMLIAVSLNSGPLFFILALNHSAAKAALFLLSGNIVQTTGTKLLSEIKGLMTINPQWSILLVLAAFAVTGAPPFGAFIAEWCLLAKVAELHLWTVFWILLISLALSFLAFIMHVGKVVCGTPRQQVATLPPIASSVIPACLLLVALVCGLTALPKFVW